MQIPESPVPLTVITPHLPESFEPLEVIDHENGVRAAVVERQAINLLPEKWKEACGFYILLSRIRGNGFYDVYVGKSSRDFTSRLKSHDQTKSYWKIAILIEKDSSVGFNSMQSSYLEGRMREVLDNTKNVNVYNAAPTGDRTLPEYEYSSMEKIIVSAVRIMLLNGYRLSHTLKAPERIRENYSGNIHTEPFMEVAETPVVPLAQKTAVYEIPLLDQSYASETIVESPAQTLVEPVEAPTYVVPSISMPQIQERAYDERGGYEEDNRQWGYKERYSPSVLLTFYHWQYRAIERESKRLGLDPKDVVSRMLEDGNFETLDNYRYQYSGNMVPIKLTVKTSIETNSRILSATRDSGLPITKYVRMLMFGEARAERK